MWKSSEQKFVKIKDKFVCLWSFKAKHEKDITLVATCKPVRLICQKFYYFLNLYSNMDQWLFYCFTGTAFCQF